ncbi:PAS domain-containing protein [Rhodocyclus tenuis]|nr:PAS domain-containing methyl-accepting chemotaxis protein [Rhodocyclus gracilis]MRD73506.1 PAS domain-containing protein [Rhodocyclus gracilis]
MFGNKNHEKIAVLEGELREARALTNALERSNAVIELGLDGRILRVNANFCAAMGYAADELIGHEHKELCDPQLANSQYYERHWANLRRGEFFRGTIKRRRKDGSDIWLEATYNPVLDDSGQPCKIVKFATDVTKQVEDAARAQAMVKAIERSMAVVEFTPDGTIQRANDNFLSTMGYAGKDVVGQHHRIFCQPADAASPAYARFWESLARGEYFSGQFCRLNRHGGEVWLEATYNPVFGPDGQVSKIVKFASDISAQIKRNAAEKEGTATAYEVALETQEISRGGEQIIHETIATMRSIAATVERSAGLVEALGTQTTQITSIVNTIKEIADQTNLLALNAAIEAARAGESGRGFAVVADEVRKLAERTAQSTGDIGSMIQGIQQETRSVSSSMGSGLAEVAEGVDLVNSAGESIQRMHNGAARVVEVIQQLSETVAG